MRTMTIKSGGGNNLYSKGWHELTISKAKYNEWNGTKCIDIYFNDYPDNFNMRVYAKEGKNGEEFAIGQVYRFANAGISSALEGQDGTKIVKMDDTEEALSGKKVNVKSINKEKAKSNCIILNNKKLVSMGWNPFYDLNTGISSLHDS